MATNRKFTFFDVVRANGRKLCNNTRVEEDSSQAGKYNIVLHSTVIAVVTEQTVCVNHGGYMTNTTKARLNSVLADYGYTVYQEDYTWYVRQFSGGQFAEPIPFQNWMVLAR